MSLREATTLDSPHPLLSAVNTSRVSTPVPKIKPGSSPSVTPVLSSLSNKIGIGPVPALDNDKEPSTLLMMPRKHTDEDLAQSSWFVRPWSLSFRSTLIATVTPPTPRRESRTPSLEDEAPTGGGSDTYSEEQTRKLDDTPVVSHVTEALTHPPGNSDSPLPIIRPPAPVDTVDTDIDNRGQGDTPRKDSNTHHGWIRWPWYGVQHTTVNAPVPDQCTLHGSQVKVSNTFSHPLGQDVVTGVTPLTYVNTNVIDPSESTPENEPDPIPPVRSTWFNLWSGNSVQQPVATKVVNTQRELPSDEGSATRPSETIPPNQGVKCEMPKVINIILEPVESTTPPVSEVFHKKPKAMTTGWSFWYRSGENETAASSSKSSAMPSNGAFENATAQPVAENIAMVSGDSTQFLACPQVDIKPVTKFVVSPQVMPHSSRNGSVISVNSERTSPTAPVSLTVDNRQRICPPNHIFPKFDSCYSILEAPSIYCALTRLFKKPSVVAKNHLYRIHSPRQVKKAVAIGVHGFFPMRIVRTVLGEPTGTSIRFAQSAAAAIRRWAESNGAAVEVETVALEGEGKVADRVDMLWKLLEKWMNHVKSADFIVIGAHSQGVVVGLQLLARMIEQGWVDNARVGVAAMAGINLGPFTHLGASILTGSAKELFEFQSTESVVSRKYVQALRVVLAHDVRIVFVGSIDDQLVPLESSTFSNIQHPYIYRAVFVDGRVHAPNFLSHLVGFAMKLRNLGISDHGLIRQLSTPLAGSLYGGEGHSRLYDDDSVYDLAVRHALETTDCSGVPLKVDNYETPAANNNPFFLPWSMRGLVEEPYVRSKLGEETQELLQKYQDWTPTSKVLKDVKFRLEGIRSML